MATKKTVSKMTFEELKQAKEKTLNELLNPDTNGWKLTDSMDSRSSKLTYLTRIIERMEGRDAAQTFRRNFIAKHMSSYRPLTEEEKTERLANWISLSNSDDPCYGAPSPKVIRYGYRGRNRADALAEHKVKTRD